MAIKVIDDKYLVDIADAIRSKTGTEDTYKPTEMADAINSITTGGSGGGDLPEEALIITGDAKYRFAYGGWDWFIENYGNQITTKELTGGVYMFADTDVKQIPFSLNFKQPTTTSTYAVNNIFTNAEYLEEVPEMSNLRPSIMSSMFKGCYRLRNFPENYGANWDWTYIDTLTSPYNGDKGYLFYDCCSLRKLPMELLKHNNPVSNYATTIYYYGFMGCYVLDEIVDLPVIQATLTSNAFVSTFQNCYRIKNMTFETNEESVPKTANWKNQVIDLTKVGYGIVNGILNFNSGITVDKDVFDYESYERLMEDEDWYSTSPEFSRYDYGSAWGTICSLPDTSAYLASNGGTNTIKFKGNLGENTPAGAINTMPEEEIAVATAKGWTVSFV